MKQLRDLLSDLVERRLWPVALALVVALVAVPVVLGRGGSTPSAPVQDATTADAGNAGGPVEKAEVTLDTSDPIEHDTSARPRSPFKAPAVKKAADASASSGSDASGSAGTTPVAATDTGSSGGASTDVTSGAGSTGTPSGTGTTDSGSTSGSGSTGTTKSKPKTTTTPTAEDKTDTYHVSLRLRVDGGELQTIRDVARLSPLPSVTDPFFVFLGVIETKTTHEKRAVFIVSSDAAPIGEGSCHPTAQDCETVELAKDQTVYFNYTKPDGAQSQYELQLAGIHKTEVKAQAKAAAAFARHSVAGAELLRDAATRNVRAAAGARAYRYLPGAGMLVRAKRKHVTAKAAAAGGLVPGLALVDRKHQPGMPVWHSPEKPKK
jgi:hypothetical protein